MIRKHALLAPFYLREKPGSNTKHKLAHRDAHSDHSINIKHNLPHCGKSMQFWKRRNWYWTYPDKNEFFQAE